MTAVSQKSTTSEITMQGGGEYNTNCQPQASDVEAAGSMLIEAARSVSESRNGQPITIADYGCAEGRNSRRVTDLLTGELEASRHPSVSIIRNDLAANDFSQLLKRAENPAATTTEIPEFEFIRSGSFYNPVLPSGMVDVACCFSALHWLSASPESASLAGHVSCEASFEMNAAFARQADNDWRAFLNCRADELAAGGRLVVSILGRTSGEPVHGPLELLQSAATVLSEEKRISTRSMEQFVIPIYRRTADEALAPFREKDSDVSRRLLVQEKREESVVCPLLTSIQNGVNLTVAANSYVRFIRAFSESIVRTGLFSDQGAPAARENLDRLYSTMEHLAVTEPERFSLRRSRILLLIQRLDDQSEMNPWPRGTQVSSAGKHTIRTGELSV